MNTKTEKPEFFWHNGAKFLLPSLSFYIVHKDIHILSVPNDQVARMSLYSCILSFPAVN